MVKINSNTDDAYTNDANTKTADVIGAVAVLLSVCRLLADGPLVVRPWRFPLITVIGKDQDRKHLAVRGETVRLKTSWGLLRLENGLESIKIEKPLGNY